MATVKLIIREAKVSAEGLCLVSLLYTHEQKTVQFSTGEKVPVEHWDAKAQKVRRSLRGYIAINDSLGHQKTELENYVRHLKVQGIEPTCQYVKVHFGKVEEKAPVDPKLAMPLLQVWDIYLQGQTLYTPNTIKRFITVKNHLLTFLTKESSCTCSDFDKQKGAAFMRYLQKQDFQNNTIGNYIKTIKTVLAWAVDNGYSTNSDYKKFVKPSAPTDIVYLTKEELHRLKNLDLSRRKSLERVRDLFLFQCATGLRYSDLANVKPEHIHGNFLEVTAIKTKDKLRIPLSGLAREILAKYEGALPRVLTNQQMNNLLKEIGQIAALDEESRRAKFYGSKRVEETSRKYELLSSHTARRTFVTLSLEGGMAPEVVMKVTGHKDYKTMLKYVRIIETKVAEQMANVWG